MVGIGTVLKDDPMLNTRLDEPDTRDPIRIIIDSRLDLPEQSKIVRSAKKQRTIVFCHRQARRDRAEMLEQNGIEVIPLAGSGERICLEEVFKLLGEMGIMSLLVEGGGEINGYLVEKGLIDKIYCFIAPKLVGGREAPTPAGGKGIPLLKDALPVKSMEISRWGDDILITGYL
jgi:diaminohydroxyphosphoribosylaminopyrimidine deaminase/5-amino-6-(5-phosphoribosylamino)uracil reductase